MIIDKARKKDQREGNMEKLQALDITNEVSKKIIFPIISY
jgi:hypothetical protein